MDNRKYNEDSGFDIKSLSQKDTNSKDNVLKKEISDYSNMKPEVVAQLIRAWMNGEDK
jgi:flagellar biosynthesis/type III secretory pathway M-ring protein FliF/YscJ